ncbi:50S ribosomal protein L30e [uncultured archaeon]|nr:50S ribosomal protein L30e [uncultured archaeon]
MKTLKEALGNLVRSGKILYGTRQTTEALLTGEPKLVVLSNNCPTEVQDTLAYYSRLAGIPLKTIQLSSRELGGLTVNPYPVSALAVLDAGGLNLAEVE